MKTKAAAKKQQGIAALVMALAILAAIPLGAHMSLTRLREEAEGHFYYDQTGYAIYMGVDERQAAASNLATVARRYTGENPALVSLIDEVEYAVAYTEGSYDDPQEEAQGNRMIGEAAQALYQELQNTQLSPADEQYPGELMAQLESEQDKINRSSYNDEARAFNARLEKFPVNLLLPVAGVQPLATFDEEP